MSDACCSSQVAFNCVIPGSRWLFEIQSTRLGYRAAARS